MNFFLVTLLFIPITITILDSTLRLIYILASGMVREPVRQLDEQAKYKIFYLIVACNEEKVIGQTLSKLAQSLNTSSVDKIGILCDHCIDATEKIASTFEAQIFIRNTGPSGKGAALSWFVNNHAQSLAHQDLIVILDADSLVDFDFNANIKKRFSAGAQVVQAFIQPVFPDPTPATILVAYSELLSQYIDETARMKLGWSAPLRGTGMAFCVPVFIENCKNLSTQVEDIEISIRLASKKITVFFEPSAIIYDPKSAALLGLARQRGRWLRGQREILHTMGNQIWNMLGSGASGLSLAQAFFFKPKIFVLTLKFFILITVLFCGIDSFRFFFVSLILLSIIPDIFYYLLGLKFTRDNLKIKSLATNFTLYFALWLASLYISFHSKDKWLRVSDNTDKSDKFSPGIVYLLNCVKKINDTKPKN